MSTNEFPAARPEDVLTVLQVLGIIFLHLLDLAQPLLGYAVGLGGLRGAGALVHRLQSHTEIRGHPIFRLHDRLLRWHPPERRLFERRHTGDVARAVGLEAVLVESALGYDHLVGDFLGS